MIETRNAITAMEPLRDPNIQPSGVMWVMYTPIAVATVVTVVRRATMAVIALQHPQHPPQEPEPQDIREGGERKRENSTPDSGDAVRPALTESLTSLLDTV